mgnify:CR=1 FL=1
MAEVSWPPLVPAYPAQPVSSHGLREVSPGVSTSGAFTHAMSPVAQSVAATQSAAGVQLDGFAPMCGRCFVSMRQGLYTAQTYNRLRPGQAIGTHYPCGPGALASCRYKCPECGHSVS